MPREMFIFIFGLCIGILLFFALHLWNKVDDIRQERIQRVDRKLNELDNRVRKIELFRTDDGK